VRTDFFIKEIAGLIAVIENRLNLNIEQQDAIITELNSPKDTLSKTPFRTPFELVVKSLQQKSPLRAGVKVGRSDTNTLLGKEVDHEGIRPGPATALEDVVGLLVLFDGLEVGVEQVARVERTALGFGVELGREDGTSLVDHTLVRAVVQVGEVLLPVLVHGCRVDGVTVVLRSDVALAGEEVESRDVVGAVTVLHLDGVGTGSNGQQLVTKTDAHDGDLGGGHQLAQVVGGAAAVGGVARTVGNEDTVEVVGRLVDREVVGNAGDRSTTGDDGADDVLLDTTVDETDVGVAIGRWDVEGRLRGYLLDKVNASRVLVCLILVGVVLLANSDLAKGRTLFTEVGDDVTSVDAGDGGNTLAGTPLCQTFDGSPVGVLRGSICDNNGSSLDVGALKVLVETVLVAHGSGHTVVANQRLGEDQNLTAVRRVGHGLGVSDERCGEDGLTADVGFCAKALSVVDRAIPDGESGALVAGLGGPGGGRERSHGVFSNGGIEPHLNRWAGNGLCGEAGGDRLEARGRLEDSEHGGIGD
jgi:hypothetical protein